MRRKKSDNVLASTENCGMQDEPVMTTNLTLQNINIGLMNFKPVDLFQPEQVRDRIAEFFNLYAENDTKPTVVGLAISLGIATQVLDAIRTGRNYMGSTKYMRLPAETVDLIRKAHQMLQNNWESYMQNGKINPVAGIFLGVNNFGYKNRTEVDFTPIDTGYDYDPEAMRRKYMLDDK